MTDTLADDKKVSPRAHFRNICESATMFVLDQFDAVDAVDVVIGAVVAKLRTDPRMPALTRNQWDEILRDPVLDAEHTLARRHHLEGLANIDEVIDAIVDGLLESLADEIQQRKRA